MNCHDCEPLIEAYFDGELDESTSLGVRRHLSECATCSVRLGELDTEAEVYSSFKSEPAVTSDLWAGVSARLGEGTPVPQLQPLEASPWLERLFTRPRVSIWAVAVLLIAAIGLTVVFMRYVVNFNRSFDQSAASQKSPDITLPSVASDRPATETSAKPNEDNARPASKVEAELRVVRSKTARPLRPLQARSQTKTPEQLVREAEQKYLSAIAMLSRTVERKRSRLDETTRAELDTALASIDRTIVNTRKIVRQHPDDPVAVQYMLTAYARKVDVLRRMSNYQESRFAEGLQRRLLMRRL